MIPLGDRVLVTPDPVEEETESGLILKQEWRPETSGIIAAIGEKVRSVKVGDHVIFSWQVGQEITLNLGEARHLLMREADLMAVIEGDEA